MYGIRPYIMYLKVLDALEKNYLVPLENVSKITIFINPVSLLINALSFRGLPVPRVILSQSLVCIQCVNHIDEFPSATQTTDGSKNRKHFAIVECLEIFY